jgi:hypothetical protein
MEMSQPEPSPHEPAVAEEFLDLGGSGVGNDIEVFRLATQEQVADAPAYKTGMKPVVSKAIEDTDRIVAEVAPGNRMIGAGDDSTSGGVHRFATYHILSGKESGLMGEDIPGSEVGGKQFCYAVTKLFRE